MSNKSKIYFIKADNSVMVKIGKSVNPQARLKSLQTGSAAKLKIIKIIDGGIYLESILHIYFKHLRKHGEWFKPNYELNSFLYNKRNISISGIYDVLYSTISKAERKYLKYLKTLENKRLYL